jgi:hypothetical protein
MRLSSGILGSARFVVVLLMLIARRNSQWRLVAGNPRRWQALALARGASELVLVEEGIGTTVHGGYFDPAVPEKNLAKRLAAAFGVLPSYQSVVARVVRHHTAYDRSIFPNPVRQDFLLGMPRASGVRLVPHDAIVVVTSMLAFGGEDRYRGIVNRLVQEGVSVDRILLSAHPRDDARHVRRFASELGIGIVDASLTLEDVLLLSLRAGHKVALYGDRNSSVSLLTQLRDPTWKFEDCTSPALEHG